MVSGLNNFYQFNLSNNGINSPISKIYMQTNRSEVSGNIIKLDFHERLKNNIYLDKLTDYVIDSRFIDVELVVYEMTPYNREVLRGRGKVGDEYASFIKVENYNSARWVVDLLFQRNEMSANDRADMENALRELEKCAEFASKSVNNCTTAQKDIIEDFVSPYIDEIKMAAPDIQTAQKWVRCATKVMCEIGPDIKNLLGEFLFNACGSGHDKSADFYDSLLSVARVCACMADLEGALSQMGATLLSREKVQQIVLALFE